MTHQIRNCEFTFKCSKLWDTLQPTPDPKIRLCDQCQRRVVFCRTAAELKRAIIDNECVAVNVPGPNGRQIFVGEPFQEYEND